MNAKEYLNQAWELNQMINDKMEKAERLRQDLYGRGVSYENNGGSSPNGGSDAISKAICKVIAFEQEADALIDKMIAIKIDIEHAIGKLDDRRYRKLLERRYLFFESFEVIAGKMDTAKNISIGFMIRLYRRWMKSCDRMRLNATNCD